MQTTENEIEVPMSPALAEPISETLHLTAEEADEIFRLAEAEIHPLLRQAKRERWIGRVQSFLCLCLILAGLIGTLYGVINSPKTTVTLFPVERPVSITTALDIPLRTLAPVTLTRSASTPATGHGHQDARAAAGTLTLYNGLFTAQTVPGGMVFTGSDGVKIATTESVTIPPSNPSATPPQLGYATVPATALQTGTVGNIAAYEINTTVINGVSVKNTHSFQNGRDARDFSAVAPQDFQSLTLTVNAALTQAFRTAFSLRDGEEALPTQCHTATAPNHQVGQEAQSVTLTASKTCSAIAYNGQELHHQATAAFTQTKPAANYHIVSSVQTTLQSVSPLLVTISGKWGYTFSPDYEQLLAQKIEGDTPAQARTYLLSTGVISSASVPDTLPSAMYINFLVLIGK